MNNLLRNLYTSVIPYETRLWLYKIRNLEQYKQLRSAVHPSPKGDFSLKPFDEHECLFIHITKTAGTSIAQSLFGYLPYHYTAIDYRVIYGRKTFDRYFKFAFVRNPWDRLYSAYRYLKAGGWNEKDREWSAANLSSFSDFNDFVKRWLSKDNISKHIHFRPQYHFVCDRKGKLLIDELYYFETLLEDFNQASKQLNINAEIGHYNTNLGESYLNAYDDEARDIVADMYREDIELFGYVFDRIANRLTIKST